MSIPPTRRSPQGQPSSKSRPEEDDDKDERKEFKLPAKKSPDESKEERPSHKQKNLFDIAGNESMVKEKQPNISSEKEQEMLHATSKVTAVDQAEQIRKLNQLIHNLVETMHIGQVGGKTYASMDLKAMAEVPSAFAGSNLTISFQENGLVIHFDNFMTLQQQNAAITLVEKNKEQLQEMMQALSEKNLQISTLSIGEHVVALPRVNPLPPPFQPTRAEKPESGQHQDRGGGEKEREDKSKNATQ